MSKIIRRFFAVIPTILILVLAIPPALLPQTVATAAAATSDKEGRLLQFTSQGHVLGFRDEGVIIASSRHMLKVDFLGSKGATPDSGDIESDGRAQALDRVTYENVWDGVSVTYEANKSSVVKSTYYLDDGAQAKYIRLGYNRPVQIDGQGNLVIKFENGTLTETAPVAWQEINGKRAEVKVAYALHGEREVGFSLGQHTQGIPVVIDPDLIWNTFLGGSGSSDSSNGISVDTSGNVFITGSSNATWGTPVRAYTSVNEAFAAKLDSSGELLWNTFLGGTGSDTGFGSTIDDSGNLYVVGDSLATWGTPLRAYTAGTDAFVAKLNGANGTLTWHTFLGGSSSDSARAIALDADGNLYVGGQSAATWGTPVRAHTLLGDIIAVKLSTDGALIWNTFLGGSGTETGSGIALDSVGNVYVVGTSGATWGSPVRAYTLGTDPSVVKLDSSGALIWNTFLGGSGIDTGQAIEVDSAGNVYVSGNSGATWGAPVRAYTSGNDAHASKLDNSGALIWNTFLGGSGSETGLAIEIDSGGNVYVSGNSNADWGAPVMAYSVGTDAMAVKLDSSGALIWNTFLGGSGTDSGTSLEVVDSAYVYISGGGSATWGAPVRAYTSGLDAYAAKFVNFVPAEPEDPGQPSAIARPPLINVRMVPSPMALPNGPGQVTYTYTLTNPGQITMTDISLIDDTCSNALFVSGDTNGNGWMETSETWTYTCTATLNKTTVNYATARGLGNGMAAVDTAIAQVVVGFSVVAPLVHIVKTANPLSLPKGGGPVTFGYTVTNPGTADLSGVTVTDSGCGNINFVGGDLNADSRLQSNETWRYSCTTNISQTLTTTAYVTADANGLTALDTALIAVIVEGSPLPALIHILKKANPVVLPARGGLVAYTYAVTNPGTVSLQNVSVTDDKCGPVNLGSGDTNGNGLLESNETWIYTCQQHLTVTTTNTATASARVNGLTVTDVSVVSVVVSPNLVAPDGIMRRLLKTACVAEAVTNDACTAVYYVGRDGKRHTFPNDKVYFTWYPDFNSVETVSLSELSSYELGTNVTYRPGALMVKFKTLNKVYAIERGGTLRWIKTEEIARALYGDNWNNRIDDVSDVFYSDYTFGPDIDFSNQYNVTGQLESNPTVD